MLHPTRSAAIQHAPRTHRRFHPLGWAAVTLLATACHHPGAPSERGAAAQSDRPAVVAAPADLGLRTEPASAALHVESRAFAGRVAFDDRRVARLGPPVQGRVARVNVVEGDRVAQGAVLMEIHSADVSTAQAQVAETRTARALAESSLRRTASLVSQGAASESERLAAQAALEQARDEERRARQALAALGVAGSASDYLLRAPMAGVVVQRGASVGSEVHVGSDDPLLTVADLSRVWVVADVYEQDVSSVHVGDEACVKVEAYPGRCFLGRVSAAGDTVDPMTRAARARVEIDNTDLALRPGMFARVEIRTGAGQAVQVPTSALLARRDEYFVFVRNAAGAFERRSVQVGEEHGQHRIVLSGLRPGESVVTEGAILLDAEANQSL